MNNRLRLLLSTGMVILLALGVVAPLLSNPEPVSAQGPFECPLTEEDCAILFGALEAAPTLTSFNIESLTAALDYDLGEEGSGQISLEAFGPLMQVEGGISPIATDMTLNATMDADGESDVIEGARLVVVDDMVYTYDPETGEWDVEEATAEDMADLDLSSIDLESIFTAVNDLSAIEGVVVWERGEDMDGLAVFTIDIRLGELLVAPEFAVMAAQLAGELGDESMDAESMGFIIGMLGAQIKPQLDESTVQMTLYISPEDNYIYGLDFVFDVDLDLAFLGALAGDEVAIPPIGLSAELEMEWSQHNEAFDIVAPEVEEMAEAE